MRSKFEISNKSLLLKFSFSDHNIKFLIYINLILFDINFILFDINLKNFSKIKYIFCNGIEKGNTVDQSDRQVELFPRSNFFFAIARYTLVDTIYNI